MNLSWRVVLIAACSLPACRIGLGGNATPSVAGGGGNTGTIDGPFSVAWNENGAARVGSFVLAERLITQQIDVFTIAATDKENGAMLGLALRATTLADGAYSCNVDGGPAAELTYDNDPTTKDVDCSMNVGFYKGSDGNPHARGTFEGTFTLDGGTGKLTDGRFDVLVNQTGG